MMTQSDLIVKLVFYERPWATKLCMWRIGSCPDFMSLDKFYENVASDLGIHKWQARDKWTYHWKDRDGDCWYIRDACGLEMAKTAVWTPNNRILTIYAHRKYNWNPTWVHCFLWIAIGWFALLTYACIHGLIPERLYWGAAVVCAIAIGASGAWVQK